MANDMNTIKEWAASRSAGLFGGELLERAPVRHEECCTLDITIRLDLSVPVRRLEDRARTLLEEKGVLLAIGSSLQDPDSTISALFVTYLTIPNVANLLLEMDGIDEVVIEVRDDDQHSEASPGELGRDGGELPLETPAQVPRQKVRMERAGGADIVRPYRRGRRIVVSGSKGEKENGCATDPREFEQVHIGSLFDSVQDIFHAVAANYERKIDLFMTGERVEVRKGNEDALIFTMVHIVKHIIDEQIGEMKACKANERAHGEVNISATSGRSRATIRFGGGSRTEGSRPAHPSMASVRTGAINDVEIDDSPGLHVDRSMVNESTDLTIAKHLAIRKGWTLEVDEIDGQGNVFTLRLDPNRGVMKAMVVQIDERFYAIDMDSVHWGVMVRSEELKAGRTHWRGEELPVVDIYAPISNEVGSGDAIQGLILSKGDAKVCALVSRLVGVQELSLDAAVDGADPPKDRWGLLDSGLRVMLIGPEDVRSREGQWSINGNLFNFIRDGL